jgi:hypothetical protein
MSGGRGAAGPAPRPAPALLVTAGMAVLAVVLLLVTGGPGAAPHPAHTANAAKYGGLPSWLPKLKARVGATLNASAGHPALSVEGEPIRVHLAGAQVLVTAVGPQVPQEGHFPVPPVTPVTFLVTFAAASGAIPIHASAFSLTDERGNVHRPHVTGLRGGAPPTEVARGRPATVELHDILPTGDGGVSWTGGETRPLASWDYTVEID